MASFHKDPRGRSPFWYVALTGADGRRAFRSTKESNLNKAQECGLRWEREAAILRGSSQTTQPDTQILKNPKVVLERFIEATNAASRGELTEASARRFLDELLSSSGHEGLSGTTTRSFLTEWVEGKKSSRAEGTYLRYRRTVDDFLECLGKRAELALAAINSTDLERFRESELSKGKRTATVGTSLKVLTAAFNRARRKNIISSNPAEALDSLPRNSAQRRAFTHDELIKVLAVCDSDWKGMVLIGYHLGLRIQDCAALTWGDVDLNRKVVRCRPQKERRDREAKKTETFLPAEIREFLAASTDPRNKPTSPLFPSLHKRKSGGDFGLSLTFRGILDKAKIDYRDVSNGKGRKFWKRPCSR